MSSPMPALAVDGATGRESFFTAAETTLKQATPGFSANERPAKAIVFGDGSELDADAHLALKDLHEYMEAEKTAVPWEAGDILVINNSSVMHSRETFTPPRRILASLCGGLKKSPVLHQVA